MLVATRYRFRVSMINGEKATAAVPPARSKGTLTRPFGAPSPAGGRGDGTDRARRVGRGAGIASQVKSCPHPPLRGTLSRWRERRWHLAGGRGMQRRARQRLRSPARRGHSSRHQCAAVPLALSLLVWYSSRPIRLIRPNCCSSHQAWSSSVSRSCAIRMSRLM